jgi:Oxidoreductase family, NAD-binding Rossmann fold
MAGKINETSRRVFMGAALGTAASYSRIKGANDRIRLGAIGTGNRCQYLLSLLQNLPGNQLVAICDVYETRRTQARLKFASYANEYTGYRKLLDDKEVDAVVIGTPDHWHTPIAMRRRPIKISMLKSR